MNRSLLLLFLSLVIVSAVVGQTEPQFTQYLFNQHLFNPAYAGSNDAVEFSALYRSQYVGLANRSISDEGFNFNMPLYGISSGIGINILNDNIGYERSTYVSLSYAYRKSFQWGRFGIGVNLGMIQASLDGSQLRTPDGVYTQGIDHNDPYVPATLQQGIAPDFSIGAYVNKEERYFAGISLDHVLYSSASIAAPQMNIKLNFSRDIYMSGGYNFRISPKFQIMPSVILKTDFTEVQTDISGVATIIDNILAGISLRGYDGRSLDALALIFGFRYKGFQAIYSYDAVLSYLGKFNAGSHEVTLKYSYKLKTKKDQGYYYHNPRFNL